MDDAYLAGWYGRSKPQILPMGLDHGQALGSYGPVGLQPKCHPTGVGPTRSSLVMAELLWASRSEFRRCRWIHLPSDLCQKEIVSSRDGWCSREKQYPMRLAQGDKAQNWWEINGD